MAIDKQHAHQLLDQLDPSQFAAVAQLLEVMIDPLARSVANAQVEDEEITLETAGELDRARASIEGGEGVPHEEILREFGLASRSSVRRERPSSGQPQLRISSELLIGRQPAESSRRWMSI